MDGDSGPTNVENGDLSLAFVFLSHI